ncbi:mRNA decay activator protein ZFP36L1-like [Carcharodon carcharias]|uniref:mRNA decay activator protein ZFP36L1-like n=1 Tax=Carcharodon carcharias TaxID=13397 RepID=UPI001B7F4B19|nr:mRNA decay activator protein ZFP36L1-like [Carcharodon carcharias]
MNGARLEELLLQSYPADNVLLCFPWWDSSLSRSRCSPPDFSLSATLCPRFPATGGSTSGFRTYPHLYKTELCRRFAESGGCKYGDRCQFAHGLHELRLLPRHPKYKTEYCRTFHTLGFCPYESRCHFIHQEGERRLPPPPTPPQIESPPHRPRSRQAGGAPGTWNPPAQARARSPTSDGVSSPSSSSSETPERCPGSPTPPGSSSSSSSSSSCRRRRLHRDNSDNYLAGRGIAELLVPLALKLRALEDSENVPPALSAAAAASPPTTVASDCSPGLGGPGEEAEDHRAEAPLSLEAGKRLPVFSWISTRST